jgi:integrase
MLRRRNEVPKRRQYKDKRTGKVIRTVWLAIATDDNGKEHGLGTFKRKGPCGERGRSDCCGQHAIWAKYDEWWGRSNAGVPTIGEYASDWTKLHPRSERTGRTDESRLRAMLDVAIERRLLRDWAFDDLRRRHVLILEAHLLVNQGRALRGVQGHLSTLSRMVEDAISDDYARDNNPVKGGRRARANDPRVKKEPREPRLWSVEEMHCFASEAGCHEPEIRMLADCGMRVGELLAMRRALQDFKVGAFRIKDTAWDGAILPSSREKNHDRIGPIAPGCLAILRQMPLRIDTEWMFSTPGAAHTHKARIAWPSYEELRVELKASSYRAVARRLGVSDNAVRNRIRAHEQPPGARLNDRGGRLWRYDNWMRDVWNPVRRRTGMDATPKDFRFSLSCHLRAAGVPEDDIADMLGHSEQVNQAHYSRSLRRSGDLIREAIG